MECYHLSQSLSNRCLLEDSKQSSGCFKRKNAGHTIVKNRGNAAPSRKFTDITKPSLGDLNLFVGELLVRFVCAGKLECICDRGFAFFNAGNYVG